MADEQTSPWEINSTSPFGFSGEYQTNLKLYYLINEHGDYVFRYKAGRGQRGNRNFWQDPIENITWTTFLIIPAGALWQRGQHRYIAELDLDIRDGDTSVFVEIVDEGGNNDMFWSPTKHALKTLKYRKKIFGNLQYWNGRRWITEGPIQPPARRIYFEARYNDRIYREDKHKFSFNVLLPMVGEFEIDPEIKNPSS